MGPRTQPATLRNREVLLPFEVALLFHRPQKSRKRGVVLGLLHSAALSGRSSLSSSPGDALLAPGSRLARRERIELQQIHI